MPKDRGRSQERAVYRCNDASSNPFQRRASVLGRLGQFIEIATAEVTRSTRYHFAGTFLRNASICSGSLSSNVVKPFFASPCARSSASSLA